MQATPRLVLALAVTLGVTAGASSGLARETQSAAESDRDLPRSERKAAAEIERGIDERRFPDADRRARELLVRLEASRRTRDEALAAAVDLHARVLIAWNRPNDAELAAATDRALALREALNPKPGDPRLAAALQRAGITRLRRVDYPAADSLLGRAVAVRRAARPADDHATAVALGYHAEALRVVKKLGPARDAAGEALALITRAAPEDTATQVRLHNTIGNALGEQGKPVESRVELERALALESGRAHPDSVVLAATCRFLARTLNLLGDLREAQALLDRAMAIQERVLGPNHPELATTCYIAAFTTQSAGDFVACRRYAERAVRIREAAFGPDHPQVGIALMMQAGALRELGEYDGGRRCAERAVAIQRSAKPPSPADLANSLTNLGALRVRMGDGRGGRECLEEAIAIRARVFGPGSPGFWVSTRLAHALLLEGRPKEAEALLDSLLASGARRNTFDDADALQVLGGAAWANGDLAKAERSFGRAFALNDSALGIASSRTLESLALRASARWARGDRASALADARRCEEVSAATLRLAARGLAEHEALAFTLVRGSGLDVMLSLAADSIGLPAADRSAVLDAVVRSRLAVLDELADEARALPRHDAALAPLVLDLERARAALAETMVESLRRQDRTGDSAIVAGRQRREAAERALAERSASFGGSERRAAAGLAEIARTLPASSALVSYVRFRTPDRTVVSVAGAAAAGGPGARYVAWVLRAGTAAPEIVPLEGAAQLDASIERWAAALATPPPATRDVARAAQRRCDAIGASVRARVWDPVVRHLAGAAEVFAVPDGALHGINPLALPAKDGRYLAERGPLIHRLAAERDLMPWADTTKAIDRGMLVMGGADFDRADDAAQGGPVLASTASEPRPGDGAATLSVGVTRSSIPDSARLRFPALPQTAIEVSEVAQLWRASGASSDVVELQGPAASEAAFKRHAPGRRVIHVATHGFALGAAAGGAAEGTRGIGGVGSEGVAPALRTPGLVPGLALAGANAVTEAGAEDGFLTAEEITALDLTVADWAVLSACETGLSDAHAVEAVQGLHRAFRRAGARTVIMSLWAVDDVATRAWMRRLYQARVTERSNTTRAVREASRAVLGERRAAGLDTHPFHWAAFVASGDWR